MDKIKTLWQKASSNKLLVRAFHTFWQAALAVVLVKLTTVHDLTDLQALATAAVAAGFSALKTVIVEAL